MKYLVKIVVLFVAGAFLISCKRPSNAECFYNKMGLVSLRKDQSVIAFIVVHEGVKKIPIEIKGGQVFVEGVENSPKLLNKTDVSGKKCTWGGVTITEWGRDTIQYNLRSGLSLWFSGKTLVGYRLLPGILSSEDAKYLRIGNHVAGALTDEACLRALGEYLKKRSYWSEY